MTALPPLLVGMAGGKPRARKAPLIRPKELELHLTVAKLLRDWAKYDWKWTHIAHGEARDKRTAAKLKAMGTQPGWPDFILVKPNGRLHCLELKRIGETLRTHQKYFRVWCVNCGIPHSVCRTIDDVLVTLRLWDCLRITIQRGGCDD